MLAIFESEELHCTELVTSFVLPFAIRAVALNCWEIPIPTEIELGETWSAEIVVDEEEDEVLDCAPPPELQPPNIATIKRSAVQNAAFMFRLR